MDYKNRKKYEGMSIDDLCDAIVDANQLMTGEDVQAAVKLLVEDLRDAILDLEHLYILRSKYTNSIYISERLSAILFEDEYYANKFVDSHSDLGIVVDKVEQEHYENLFSVIHDCGIGYVEFSGAAEKNVKMFVDDLFLGDSYNKDVYSAVSLNRFVTMLMQEVRNKNRDYDRKEEIVTLLKKNVIATLMECSFWVPVIQLADGADTKFDLVSVVNADQQAFFPVCTNLREAGMLRLAVSNVSFSQFKASAFIRAVATRLEVNPNVIGITVNPAGTNFTMNREIISICLENFRENNVK